MTETIVKRMRLKPDRDKPDIELLRLLSAAGLKQYGPFAVPAADKMTSEQIRAWWRHHCDCDAMTKAKSAAEFQKAICDGDASYEDFKRLMAERWREESTSALETLSPIVGNSEMSDSGTPAAASAIAGKRKAARTAGARAGSKRQRV